MKVSKCCNEFSSLIFEWTIPLRKHYILSKTMMHSLKIAILLNAGECCKPDSNSHFPLEHHSLNHPFNRSKFGCWHWITLSTDHLQLLLSSSTFMSFESQMTFLPVEQKEPLSKCQSSFPYKNAWYWMLGYFEKKYISGRDLNSNALCKSFTTPMDKHTTTKLLHSLA